MANTTAAKEQELRGTITTPPNVRRQMLPLASMCKDSLAGPRVARVDNRANQRSMRLIRGGSAQQRHKLE